jgi:hypothetical protein
MKQHTNKEQTKKLIDLGFPQPSLVKDEDGEMVYTIGELIHFLGVYMLSISTTKILDYETRYRVQYTKNPETVGWTEIQGELIDKLFTVCVELKLSDII